MKTNYYSRWAEHKNRLQNEETKMEREVAEMLKKHGQPLFIGNMVYSFIEDKIRGLIPTYCYVRDYGTDKGKFFPIHDKEQTYEFGWVSMEEVTRIFNVIVDKLETMLITELCDECGLENDFRPSDFTKLGVALCKNCKKPMPPCSLCDWDKTNCTECTLHLVCAKLKKN